MIKLKNVRYFGRFYEYDGKLGWMPFYKVAMIYIMGFQNNVKWIPQEMIKFGKSG